MHSADTGLCLPELQSLILCSGSFYPIHGILISFDTGLCLPELQSLILCSGSFYPIHGILISFPMTVVVHCLRNCVIVSKFFFVGISTKRVQWCEEDSLPSFVASMSTQNQSILQDRLNAEKNKLCEKKLFQVVRNSKKPHQRRFNWSSTRMSLN